MCEKIWNLNQENVLSKASPYIANLFDEKKSIRSIVVNPSKFNEVQKIFSDINILKIENLQLKAPKF